MSKGHVCEGDAVSILTRPLGQVLPADDGDRLAVLVVSILTGLTAGRCLSTWPC